MPANLQALNDAIAALTAQADATVTTEAVAKTLIEGFATQVTAAVTAALTADNAAGETSIAAAAAAIKTVKDRFTASASDLGAAIANVPGGGTPPPAVPA